MSTTDPTLFRAWRIRIFTSTWIAYNDRGGSNHYEGITGPNADRCSPLLSVERPFSRGFAWLRR